MKVFMYSCQLLTNVLNPVSIALLLSLFAINISVFYIFTSKRCGFSSIYVVVFVFKALSDSFSDPNNT